MSSTFLPTRFLFRFSVSCRRTTARWTAQGIQLDDSYLVPELHALEGRPSFAKVKAAWNPRGLFFQVQVTGKRQAPWCRESRLDASDGLHLWIDTRDARNIHRATRFCHRFAFLPAGGGRGEVEPLADQLLIDRARENARPVRPKELATASQLQADGYLLSVCVKSEALTGFEPNDNPKLGFACVVQDRELGEQTFTVSSEFPFREDPSLWSTLELAR